MNGWELGSGSVRIHDGELQTKIFGLVGIDEQEAQARFGFLLDAFRYGAPPHAGFAFGLDRLAAMLAGEDNIREVIAFPKTQSGSDPLTHAPTPDRRRTSRRARAPTPSEEGIVASGLELDHDAARGHVPECLAVAVGDRLRVGVDRDQHPLAGFGRRQLVGRRRRQRELESFQLVTDTRAAPWRASAVLVEKATR